MNKRSRSRINDTSARPVIASSAPDITSYDTVIAGFPIRRSAAPGIIGTFPESFDLSGKKIVPFCTSCGSDTVLHKDVSGDVKWAEGRKTDQPHERSGDPQLAGRGAVRSIERRVSLYEIHETWQFRAECIPDLHGMHGLR
ncbi:MAG: hypothetical protein K6E42_01195 [Synergistes sp.]|nr:hypothetical protein [Synergistes sp.]